jgi:hypothetical protein
MGSGEPQRLGPYRTSYRIVIGAAERGTENLRLHVNLVQVAAGASAVQSRIETYRAKAREFARLTLVAKSLRDSRQYRKLEMYWALALGEEPEDARPSKHTSKEHDMTIYPVEFHRRLEQKWTSRIDQILTVTGKASPPRDPNNDEDEEEEHEERPDEPAVVREPDED